MSHNQSIHGERAPFSIIRLETRRFDEDANNHRGKSWRKPTSRAPALAYLRTSSAANVGTDKDSEKRQRHAILGFAKRAGFEIVEEFYDAAISGAEVIAQEVKLATVRRAVKARSSKGGTNENRNQ